VGFGLPSAAERSAPCNRAGSIRIRIVRVLLVAALVLASYELATVAYRPLAQQPEPDAQEYADSARNLAHGEGYSTTVRDMPTHPSGRHPPRYPPGFPIALAPFALFGDFPANVQAGAKLIAVVYLLVMAMAALRLGGPLGALIAVVLVWMSPFASTSASLVMSDALGALLAVALLPLVDRRTRGAWVAAGGLAGFAIAVRLSAVAVLASLLLTLKGRARGLAAAGAAPFLIGISLWQWMAFGAPWRTGYGYWLPGLETFSVGSLTRSGPRDGPWVIPDRFGHDTWLDLICHPCPVGGAMASLPSWIFYPLVLAGLFWVFAPPLVGVAGLAASWMRRREAAAKLTLWTSALTLAVQLPYFYQAARFMAAPASMLTVMAAIGIARSVERLPFGTRCQARGS